jgi:hypothetical protein
MVTLRPSGPSALSVRVSPRALQYARARTHARRSTHRRCAMMRSGACAALGCARPPGGTEGQRLRQGPGSFAASRTSRHRC